MDGHVAHGGTLPLTAAAWFAMTAAMMSPVVFPWVRVYATLLGPSAGRGWVGATWAFAAGYGTVWAGFSLVTASAQLALASRAWLAGDRLTPALGAAVFVGAGLFQFSALKASCLTHCRNPLGYFLQHWHDGPPGGWRLGAAHGLYCLGCCWALMLTAFAVGTMHAGWMLVLTAVAVAEQTLPRGEQVARAAGLASIAWGAATFVRLAVG